ncbi:MAG: tetratricopeptide repeat protein [Deltaproteobacteria bacterium]|nr:tetratricopeptide repeat protein [Deltaproteobacteria bacterium]
MDKRFHSNIYLPLILIVAGLAVYSNAFGGPFVFDDRPFIVENEWIKSPGNFLMPAGLRYVGDLSFAINFYFNGLDTFGYHLVNIILHISNAVLLFFLVRGIFHTPVLRGAFASGRDGRLPELAAFSVSAIFLVHPMQIQAVTYISQRYTSLAAFFYLASLVCFLRSRRAEGRGKARRFFYAVSLISTVMAMKTKEISFTIPFMMLIFDAAFFNGDRKLRGRALHLAPFFLAALIIPVSLILPDFGILQSGNRVEELMRAHKLEEAGGISRYGYLLTQTKVIVTYIRLLFFPAHSGFTYHFPLSETIFEPAVLSASIALIILIFLAVYLFARSVRAGNAWGLLVSLGLAWFFVTLSIESSVIPIKDAFNERRIYLPSIGMTLAFVSAVFYAREAVKKRWNMGLGAGTLTLLLCVVPGLPFSAATYARNDLWNDELSLYADEVRKNPYTTSTHMYLGIEYYNRGMTDKALSEFMVSKKLNPSSVYVRRTLATYYVNTGDYGKAIRETREILGIDSDNMEARYNLGVLYMSTGLLTEAEAELGEVLKLDGENRGARRALERIEKLKKRAGNFK